MVHSRDINRFRFNTFTKLVAEPSARYKVHRPPDQFLQEEFQIEVAIEARWRVELNQHVDVAGGRHSVAGGRAEHRQRDKTKGRFSGPAPRRRPHSAD